MAKVNEGCPFNQGNPKAKDPTYNVIALVELHAKRADDLRVAHDALDSERHRHQLETAKLRAEHSKEMDGKETDRLDAIRQTDTTNSDSKAATVAAAVSALAATTTTNADNIRLALVNSDNARAKQLETTVSGINDRMLSLDRAVSEGMGKARYADPALADSMKDIRDLLVKQAKGEGGKGGMRDMAGWIFGGIMGLVGVAGLVVALLK